MCGNRAEKFKPCSRVLELDERADAIRLIAFVRNVRVKSEEQTLLLCVEANSPTNDFDVFVRVCVCVGAHARL